MKALSPLNIREIRDLMEGRVQLNVPLRPFTSFRIGGPADLIAEPEGTERLARLLCYLRDNEIRFVLLGLGTNVLFSDAGFRGVVIRTASLRGFSVEANGADHARVTVAAGVGLPVVVGRTARLGWTGLEPLWGIPGSFGGAVVTNAGAGALAIGDVLVEARFMNQAGEELVLERKNLHFEYRCSKLPKAAVFVEGTLRLSRGDRESIASELRRARARRRSTQPLGQSSAGCVFKNPAADNPAGAIIDRLGFKGMTIGGAQVSEVHANFIVNKGNATARDVMALVEHIRDRVKKDQGVELELEIRVIGEEGPNA